jgi:hypothetical protein
MASSWTSSSPTANETCRLVEGTTPDVDCQSKETHEHHRCGPLATEAGADTRGVNAATEPASSVLGQGCGRPDHDEAVPGTVHIIEPSDFGTLDRIGGRNGTYFSPDGTPFGQRSLPLDRLNFERNPWQANLDHSRFSTGEVKVEASEIAAAFGQKGGGTQYRFLDADGNAQTRAELERLDIIVKGR